MRSNAPTLLPILRSRTLALILTELAIHPDLETQATTLSRDLRIPLTTVQQDLKRLTDAGLVLSRKLGPSRLVRMNTATPLAAPLTQLLTLTFGPPAVIGEEFGRLASVAAIVLFGSWAARSHGESGPPPRDVDVLLIGTPARQAMYEAAAAAEQRLTLPVNPVARPALTWLSGDDALIRDIQSSPYLVLAGELPDPIGQQA